MLSRQALVDAAQSAAAKRNADGNARAQADFYKAEEKRVSQCTQILGALDDILLQAAQQPDRRWKLLKLDYEPGGPTGVCNIKSSVSARLTSPAHKNLVEQIQRLDVGVTVLIHEEPRHDEGQGRSWKEYWLVVETPSA